MQRQIKTKRPVRFSDDGLTVFITLPCGSCAMIDRRVYEQFVQDGMSLNWYSVPDRHGTRYVHVYDGRVGNNVPVARQIMGAGRGEVIAYKNGKPLDLRTQNLRRRKGPARRALDRVVFQKAPAGEVGAVARGFTDILQSVASHIDPQTINLFARIVVAAMHEVAKKQ